MKVVLSHVLAKEPTRASEYSAGYDLYACEQKIIEKRSHALVDIGIKIALPNGTYGRIAPRSGLAVKHGLDVGAGVIDSDYRGIVKVVLFNHKNTDFIINVGDRIAQLIIEEIRTPKIDIVSSLDYTERGERGFGSSSQVEELVQNKV